MALSVLRNKITRMLVAGLALACVGTNSAQACGEVLRGEMVVSSREAGPALSGESATFPFLGAGWFRAVEVVKVGGFGDNTLVTLELDGEPAITASFADLKKPWMQLNTPLMVTNVVTDGNTSTMTLWYMLELKFGTMAVLRVDVAEEGVESLKIRTVMNKPAPHEHLLGQAPAAPVLPAFK
ncbi:MAG: hypothetical protein ACKVP2_16455 [Burkholderiales bacterium]